MLSAFSIQQNGHVSLALAQIAVSNLRPLTVTGFQSAGRQLV